MNDPNVSGVLLWILLGLFCLRVLGQVLVVLHHPRWLPPMSQWYSGLLAYRFLLPIQGVFIVAMALMAHSVTRSRPGSATTLTDCLVPGPEVARGLVWFSYLYAGSMAVRYVIRMARRPDQRWFGGTIPIIFHVVLAAFVYVFGRYYVR